MLSKRVVLLLLAAVQCVTAFTQSKTAFQRKSNILHSEAASPTTTFTKNPSVKPSEDWELDCYSRPVMVNGKKLWEVLLTDSTGSFRLCETIPSNKWVHATCFMHDCVHDKWTWSNFLIHHNRVNSRELRRIVDEAIDNSDVKPGTVRFFRGAMFNMVSRNKPKCLMSFSSMKIRIEIDYSCLIDTSH